MVRKTLEQRLAELEARRTTLKARLGKQDRARDTRRKVLLGALVLHRLESSDDPDFTSRLAAWLRRELPGFLTRDGDREILGDLTASPPEIIVASDLQDQRTMTADGGSDAVDISL